MDASTQPLIFFETIYGYRKPSTLAFGLLFTGVASYVCCLTAVQLFEGKFKPELTVGMIIGPLWLACILGLGLWCLWMFAFDFHVASRLDSMGITRGRSFQPWDTIAWIGGVRVNTFNRQGIVLSFQLRTRWPLAAVRHVVMQPISDGQYEIILDQIEAFLASTHPCVTVG